MREKGPVKRREDIICPTGESAMHKPQAGWQVSAMRWPLTGKSERGLQPSRSVLALLLLPAEIPVGFLDSHTSCKFPASSHASVPEKVQQLSLSG